VTERVLSQRELNRALLARQLLLERAPLPLPRAVERMGGIQAQYAPSAYIGLWSRVEGFEREQLTRALERRTLIQATLLRGTIHIVSRRDYWLWAEAIRESRREWLRRAWPKIATLDLESAGARLREALRDGPRRRDELVALVGKDEWQGAAVELVRVPPSGTWERRRADLFGLADDWVGPNEADPAAGRALLVRRYLGAFGPARLADIRSWSGLGRDEVEDALAALSVRRFRDEQGKEVFDLARAPLPDPETPAPPRFIGTWDAILLVHVRRTGVLPEELRPRIFHTRAPQSFNTFLVDGAVAGTWRFEEGRVRLEPLRRLTREEREELETEAERLSAFHT
jgi:hypothetical protein